MARFNRLLTCREVTKGKKESKAFCLERFQIEGYAFQKKRSYNFIGAERKIHTEQFHQEVKERGSRKEC